MISPADPTPTVFVPDAAAETAPAGGRDARAIAADYLHYVSALWRGDPAAKVFDAWLRRHWSPTMPPPPTSSPVAVSPHGGTGQGIRWYDGTGEVLGYVVGGAGGYRVPTDAAPPAWTAPSKAD